MQQSACKRSSQEVLMSIRSAVLQSGKLMGQPGSAPTLTSRHCEAAALAPGRHFKCPQQESTAN